MLNIISAFGLAGASGLNAYIPLLIVAVLAHYPLGDPALKLAEPYNLLGEWWAIVIISILLIIEMLVDKIPAVDSLNDGIQTFIRPAAGAILFAASANLITEIHPAVSLIAGLLVAGGVHTVKMTARPVVTASTVGTGNWAVSLLEDVTAVVVTLLAIFVPILAAILFIIGGVAVIRFIRRRQRRKRHAFQA
ncbi:MAG: DUF4126 domain-containing protein [Chloroflexi bacterium]|nr:DUF4126 domain-containing protein [Ardenticatenaceae bacterium]MBL1130688.1 DUF4126 domain-containing protein [Chloroflexota bacterium]NOG36782.1 DUF4126 domain-containing protein [Chloroflexota bacterium]GIK57099.1 MAG: hypothetical protein BroJett015_27620 [Chloroflexota bacterium]